MRATVVMRAMYSRACSNCCRLARWVKSPLRTSRSGLVRSTSCRNASAASEWRCGPKWRSDAWTMLAEAPPHGLPNLSEHHTGLLDTHREKRQRESNTPVIDIRLAAALVLGLGLLAFGGGFWMGRSSAFTKPSPMALNPAADGVK